MRAEPKPPASNRRWSSQDDAILHARYPDADTAALAASLGRSINSLHVRARWIGTGKSAAFLAGMLAHLRDGEIGSACRFQPGQVPWNKGTAFEAGGRSASTRFKAGQLNGRAAQLVQPIGAYRVNSDGYLQRKLSDTPGPSKLRWEAVHRLVWVAAHGPVPACNVVVFKPGRRSTELARITLDAIELIPRRELMRRNSVHTQYPPEMARLVQLRGALVRAINRKQRAADARDDKSQDQPAP